MFEVFLLAILVGYVGTVAGNITSDKVHDSNTPETQWVCTTDNNTTTCKQVILKP